MIQNCDSKQNYIRKIIHIEKKEYYILMNYKILFKIFNLNFMKSEFQIILSQSLLFIDTIMDTFKIQGRILNRYDQGKLKSSA